MLLKRSNSIHSWSSTISLPSRVFKFTNWVNSLKRTHSISNSYLLISIFAFPKALLLNSHQIRQRILIGSWFYNYYDFMRKLLLPTSPSLVHSEIMHRNYVVSSITALLQISTKICLPTYLHSVAESTVILHHHWTPEACLTDIHFGLGHKLHLSSDPSSLKPLCLPRSAWFLWVPLILLFPPFRAGTGILPANAHDEDSNECPDLTCDIIMLIRQYRELLDTFVLVNRSLRRPHQLLILTKPVLKFQSLFQKLSLELQYTMTYTLRAQENAGVDDLLHQLTSNHHGI